MALTDKQKKYCRGRAEGKTMIQAYDDAGYSKKGTRKTRQQNADTMEKRSAHSQEILDKIAELKRRAEEGAILDAEARQQLLTDFALDPKTGKGDRMKALDILNKMTGSYTDKLQLTGGVSVDIETERANLWAKLTQDGRKDRQTDGDTTED